MRKFRCLSFFLMLFYCCPSIFQIPADLFLIFMSRCSVPDSKVKCCRLDTCPELYLCLYMQVILNCNSSVGSNLWFDEVHKWYLAWTVQKHSDVQVYAADSFLQCASKIYFVNLSYGTACYQAVTEAVCLYKYHNVEIQYWGHFTIASFEDLSLKVWPQQICRMKLCCVVFSYSVCSSAYVWASCEVLILVRLLHKSVVFEFLNLNYPFKQLSMQAAMCSKVILYCLRFHLILCFFLC